MKSHRRSIEPDDEDPREMTNLVLHHPSDHTRYRALPRSGVQEIEPLLIEVLKDGQLVYDLPTIEAMRAQRRADMNRLDAGVRRAALVQRRHPGRWQRGADRVQPGHDFTAGVVVVSQSHRKQRDRIRFAA